MFYTKVVGFQQMHQMVILV